VKIKKKDKIIRNAIYLIDSCSSMPNKGNTKGVHIRWFAHVRSEALVRTGLMNNLCKQTLYRVFNYWWLSYFKSPDICTSLLFKSISLFLNIRGEGSNFHVMIGIGPLKVLRHPWKKRSVTKSRGKAKKNLRETIKRDFTL